MPHPLLPTLRDLIAVLDRAGVPYMVMGGLAVRVWSFPRATYDVDLTISCDRGRLAALIQRLEASSFSVPKPFRSGWVDQLHQMDRLKVQRYIREKPVDVDLFLTTTAY